MDDAAAELERKVRRKFRSLSPTHTEQIIRDLQRLMAAGLRSEKNLSEVTLNPSADLPIRELAAWFLARLAPKSVSVPVLLRLLAESPPTLRAEAARSLGVAGSKAALPILLDVTRNPDEDPLVRESSVHALGCLRDPRGLDVLLSIARDERESPHIRGLAIEQIGLIGAPRPDVLETLRSLLRTEPVDISFWAIHALGELGDESSVPALYEVAEADGRQVPPFGTLRDEALLAVDQIRSRRRRPR